MLIPIYFINSSKTYTQVYPHLLKTLISCENEVLRRYKMRWRH